MSDTSSNADGDEKGSQPPLSHTISIIAVDTKQSTDKAINNDQKVGSDSEVKKTKTRFTIMLLTFTNLCVRTGVIIDRPTSASNILMEMNVETMKEPNVQTVCKRNDVSISILFEG